jgi:hypothetical protein
MLPYADRLSPASRIGSCNWVAKVSARTAKAPRRWLVWGPSTSTAKLQLFMARSHGNILIDGGRAPRRTADQGTATLSHEISRVGTAVLDYLAGKDVGDFGCCSRSHRRARGAGACRAARAHIRPRSADEAKLGAVVMMQFKCWKRFCRGSSRLLGVESFGSARRPELANGD